MKNDKPSWYPVLCDDAYFARLREDYPIKAGWSDEKLHEYFNYGAKYSTMWDHLGEAYVDYEKLADAFLELEKKFEDLQGEQLVDTYFIKPTGENHYIEVSEDTYNANINKEGFISHHKPCPRHVL